MDQIKKIGSRNHFGIVVMSETYCKKVDGTGESGVDREWTQLSQISPDPVIFTYLSDYTKDVIATPKLVLGDRPMLKFHKSNLQTLFTKLLLPTSQKFFSQCNC